MQQTKSTKLTKLVGVSLLAISTAVTPLILSTSAQAVEPGVGAGVYEREGVYEDNDFDWGWLGLIGLAGLAGLAGKGKGRRNDATAYQEPESVRNNYRE
ncbi:WGxxGxxG-CTERM domain-containing protein [Gloeocapsopsis crepidinum LEGE 06123]|uniref:WGxxGxxG-CTERM domain-containing protein n=1 Tax=Gloeocapsopsis crepidinum LEGE 06123 TaxID=588587 RepID=A0ABR9UYX7_9CHRO|nr:WGxxGxxG family protein [Gloeocapsopsis crepidinum]MBE9193514.1 WGxxGxxG-CTERM domain-containing protein [Gloeocapsopsis crepidinum LEGE 06123]